MWPHHASERGADIKMRCMSVCLVCYNMCFVFIADNKRPLEERKQQSLILYAGQAFLHSKVWSIHTLRAGSTWGGWGARWGGGVTQLWTLHAHISGANGRKACQVITVVLLHAHSRMIIRKYHKAKWTNGLNKAISLLWVQQERAGGMFQP